MPTEQTTNAPPQRYIVERLKQTTSGDTWTQFGEPHGSFERAREAAVGLHCPTRIMPFVESPPAPSQAPGKLSEETLAKALRDLWAICDPQCTCPKCRAVMSITAHADTLAAQVTDLEKQLGERNADRYRAAHAIMRANSTLNDAEVPKVGEHPNIHTLEDRINFLWSKLARERDDFKKKIADLEKQLTDRNADCNRATEELGALKEQVAAGTRELRRYVEGNGFTWCEEESTVFNVTTAIGWMGGALQTGNQRIAALESQLAAAERMLSDQPRNNTHLPKEFQRLWESCVSLMDKGDFKHFFRYLESVETKLRETQASLEAASARRESVDVPDPASTDLQNLAVRLYRTWEEVRFPDGPPASRRRKWTEISAEGQRAWLAVAKVKINSPVPSAATPEIEILGERRIMHRSHYEAIVRRANNGAPSPADLRERGDEGRDTAASHKRMAQLAHRTWGEALTGMSGGEVVAWDDLGPHAAAAWVLSTEAVAAEERKESAKELADVRAELAKEKATINIQSKALEAGETFARSCITRLFLIDIPDDAKQSLRRDLEAGAEEMRKAIAPESRRILIKQECEIEELAKQLAAMTERAEAAEKKLKRLGDVESQTDAWYACFDALTRGVGLANYPSAITGRQEAVNRIEWLIGQAAETDQLRTQLADATRQIANYQTYGQGGATFQESQWIERLAQAEQSRDATIEELTRQIAEVRRACDRYITAAECNTSAHVSFNSGPGSITDLRAANAEYCAAKLNLEAAIPSLVASDAASGGDKSASRKLSPFVCPTCGSHFFRTFQHATASQPQIIECKGHWNGRTRGDKYTGCTWRGTFDEARAAPTSAPPIETSGAHAKMNEPPKDCESNGGSDRQSPSDERSV